MLLIYRLGHGSCKKGSMTWLTDLFVANKYRMA